MATGREWVRRHRNKRIVVHKRATAVAEYSVRVGGYIRSGRVLKERQEKRRLPTGDLDILTWLRLIIQQGNQLIGLRDR